MSWYTKNELKAFRNEWVEQFQTYVSDLVGPQYEPITLILVGIGLLVGLFIILDFIIKNIILYFIRRLIQMTNFEWDNHLYDHKVFNSVIHLIPLAFVRLVAPYVLYPIPNVLNSMEKVFDIAFVRDTGRRNTSNSRQCQLRHSFQHASATPSSRVFRPA